MADEQQTSDTPPIEEASHEESFGLKHILAIGLSIGLSVLIVLGRHVLRDLRELTYLGGFLIMLISNASIFLPIPGLPLLFSLGGSVSRPLWLGLAAGPGAALGEMSGYLAGYGGSALVDNFTFYRRIEGWMDRYGLIVITALAAFPNPIFDAAGVAAGAMRIKWWRFLLAAMLGKTIQTVMVAYAGFYSIDWVFDLIARRH